MMDKTRQVEIPVDQESRIDEEYRQACVELEHKLHSRSLDRALVMSSLAGLILLLRTNSAVCTWVVKHGWTSLLVASIVSVASIVAMVVLQYKPAAVPLVLSLAVSLGTPSVITGHGEWYTVEPILLNASVAYFTVSQLQRRLAVGWLVLMSIVMASIAAMVYYRFAPPNGAMFEPVFDLVMIPSMCVVEAEAVLKYRHKKLTDKLWGGDERDLEDGVVDFP